MWRSAEKNLDKFELYVLKNVFAIPDDLELVCAPVRLLLLSQARGASSPFAPPSPLHSTPKGGGMNPCFLPVAPCAGAASAPGCGRICKP